MSRNAPQAFAETAVSRVEDWTPVKPSAAATMAVRRSPAPLVEIAEPGPAPGRDLRLDFFRGLALLFIFLDHIPGNLVSWITVRNYGFSDAAEIFVFISGYTAAMVYGRAMRQGGFWHGAARILRRCWQLYVAHLAIFLLFMAQAAYAVAWFHNGRYAQETQLVELLANPPSTLVQALLLRFRPPTLDILPLYVMLLLVFPLALWLLQRWPAGAFLASASLYGIVRATGVNLPGYPQGGSWYFNPLAWQFLFILGALCGRLHNRPQRVLPRAAVLRAIAIAYLGFAFLVTLTWHLSQFAPWFPAWFTRLPLDKTALDPLRLLHFFALAYVTVCLMGERPRFLEWRLVRPVIRCGQQSLYVFCAGLLLSFGAHVVLVEVNDAFGMQLLVSLIGIGLSIGLASLLGWHCRVENRTTAPRKREARPVSYA